MLIKHNKKETPLPKSQKVAIKAISPIRTTNPLSKQLVTAPPSYSTHSADKSHIQTNSPTHYSLPHADNKYTLQTMAADASASTPDVLRYFPQTDAR